MMNIKKKMAFALGLMGTFYFRGMQNTETMTTHTRTRALTHRHQRLTILFLIKSSNCFSTPVLTYSFGKTIPLTTLPPPRQKHCKFLI